MRACVFVLAASLEMVAAMSCAAPVAASHSGIARPVSVTAAFGMATAIPTGYYQLCKRNITRCAPTAGTLKTAPGGAVRMNGSLFRQLVAINSAVNSAIRPVDDMTRFHVADVWSIEPIAGDCEDYALTKKARLMASGWPSGALLIALATTAWGAEHAVLIARTDQGDFVSDNIIRHVVPWTPTIYRWKSIQSPHDTWTWFAMGESRRVAGTGMPAAIFH